MRALRILLGAFGVAAMGYAVLGAARDPDVKALPHLLFLAVLPIAHDGFLLPIAIGVGVLLRLVVPRRVRGLVLGGLVVSASVTVATLPLVLGLGRKQDNPSALPLNYGRGLLIVLAAVWAVIGLLALGMGLVRWRPRPGGPARPAAAGARRPAPGFKPP
jgi:hypothetical protein